MLGSLLNSAYRDDVDVGNSAAFPAPAAGAAQDSIAAATQIAEQAGPRGAALLDSAQAAFVNGLSIALLVGAGVLFAASAIVALLAPHREDLARAEEVEPEVGTEPTAPALAGGA